MQDTTDMSFDDLRAKLRLSARNSNVVALAKTIIHPLRHTASRVADYTSGSHLYRWLTKEPDPEVIVIDLRDTYTVGPFIVLLDSLLDRIADFNEWLAPYWNGSMLNRFFDWTIHQLYRAADTRMGRTLRRLFEPPEPPNDEHD